MESPNENLNEIHERVEVSQNERKEAQLAAGSYLIAFLTFSTVLVPGISLLFGRDLGYFYLSGFTSNIAFIACIIVAIGGIICSRISKESLSTVLNVLSVGFNGLLIWIHSMEGFLATVFGFFLLCIVGGFVFLIVSIATLTQTRLYLQILANKNRRPIETVRLWTHGAMLAIIGIGLIIGAVLLLEM